MKNEQIEAKFINDSIKSKSQETWARSAASLWRVEGTTKRAKCERDSFRALAVPFFFQKIQTNSEHQTDNWRSCWSYEGC